MDIIGLVPAAGMGTRLTPLPCSKELFPIGFSSLANNESPHPKVISQYLLELYKKAGAEQVYFILRDGKWDIPAYYGDGTAVGLHIAYLLMQLPHGTPYSLDQAFPFIKEKQVLFGFPDILIEPDDVFVDLLSKRKETQADIVLGTFDIPLQQKWDVLEVRANGEVKTLTPKITNKDNALGWAVATWGPRFSLFMHTYLQDQYKQMTKSGNFREMSVGEVLQAAISNGFIVQSVYFSAGKCLDVGTPENLRLAVQSLY